MKFRAVHNIPLLIGFAVVSVVAIVTISRFVSPLVGFPLALAFGWNLNKSPFAIRDYEVTDHEVIETRAGRSLVTSRSFKNEFDEIKRGWFFDRAGELWLTKKLKPTGHFVVLNRRLVIVRD